MTPTESTSPELEPRDFEFSEVAGARVLARRGYEWLATAAVENPITPLVVGRTAGGRRAHAVVQLPDGERILFREYLRGGAIRHLNRATYFLGHRAFDELRVTVEAGRRGVSVPPVFAAIERPARIGYTATLLVGWIEGAVDLARWVETVPAAERVEMMRRVGAEIARMHDAGIVHPDLNLRNLLVSPDREGSSGRVVIIDFDRAKVRNGPLPARLRRAAIRRMTRSSWSLGAPIGIPETEALAAGYGAAWPFAGPHG